jgi:hypothetical protein
MKSDESGSMRPPSILRRSWIVMASAAISIVASSAYGCTFGGVAPDSWHSFCGGVSWIGLPGLLVASVVPIPLMIAAPLTTALLVMTLVNFLLYLGLGLGLRKLAGAFGNVPHKKG